MEDGFRYVEGSRTHRIECIQCGRHGMLDGRWQDDCRRPHDHICRCGKRYPKLMAIATHIRRHRELHGDLSHFRITVAPPLT